MERSQKMINDDLYVEYEVENFTNDHKSDIFVVDIHKTLNCHFHLTKTKDDHLDLFIILKNDQEEQIDLQFFMAYVLKPQNLLVKAFQQKDSILELNLSSNFEKYLNSNKSSFFRDLFYC